MREMRLRRGVYELKGDHDIDAKRHVDRENP